MSIFTHALALICYSTLENCTIYRFDAERIANIVKLNQIAKKRYHIIASSALITNFYWCIDEVRHSSFERNNMTLTEFTNRNKMYLLQPKIFMAAVHIVRDLGGTSRFTLACYCPPRDQV